MKVLVKKEMYLCIVLNNFKSPDAHISKCADILPSSYFFNSFNDVGRSSLVHNTVGSFLLGSPDSVKGLNCLKFNSS